MEVRSISLMSYVQLNCTKVNIWLSGKKEQQLLNQETLKPELLLYNRELWKGLPITNSRSSVLDDWYKGSTKEIQSEPFLIKLEQGQQTNKKEGEKTQTTVATFPFQFKLRPFGFLTQ